MSEFATRYLFADQRGDASLDTLRVHLKQLSFYNEFNLSQKVGGRDGDLGVQEMKYEIHCCGGEGGRTTGSVSIYSLIDDGANGYAHLMSVVVVVPEGERKQDLLHLLDTLGFVSNHRSFKERRSGWKKFRSYIDEPIHIPWAMREFEYRQAAAA